MRSPSRAGIIGKVTRLIPPPLYLAAAAGAQRVLSRRRTPTRTSWLSGLALEAAAGALAGRALVRFNAHGTTFHPEAPELATSLVTDGPYRFTRNPMYLAMATVLVAEAVRRRSLPALLPAAAFVAVVDRVQVRAEEEALRALFGEEYDAYRARVPRWLGPIG